MTTYSWKGGSGSWNTAADWSPSGTPDTSDDVLVTASGTYTVTISGVSDGADTLTTAAGVTLDIDDGATLTVDGAFGNKGTLSIDATSTVVFDDALTRAKLGTFKAAVGATLDFAGTLTNTAATLKAGLGTALGGTIDGGVIQGTVDVTVYDLTVDGGKIEGTVDASGSYASLTLESGATIAGVGGLGDGTIDITGFEGALILASTETIGNATIDLGYDSNYAPYADTISASAGDVATLASTVTIEQANLGAGFGGAGTIVNDGTITAGYSSGAFGIDTTKFTNAGTLAVSNGDTVTLGSTTSFTNTGTITVDATSTAVFNDALTTAQLGTFKAAAGATLDFAGTLTNTGATLDAGLGTALGGTIDGGVIEGTVDVTVYDFTVDGGEIEGTVDVSGSYASLTLEGGPTIGGAGGVGDGTIDITGFEGALILASTETIGKATIDLGYDSNYAPYADTISASAGDVATLASTVTIDQINLGAGFGGAGTIVNDGTIAAGYADGDFDIDTATFTNAGTIGVSAGETAFIEGAFTNFASGKLTDGAYTVGANSELEIYSAKTLSTLAASVTLTGTGSDFDVYNSTSSVTSTLDATLRTITAKGELELLDDRDWAVGGAVVNDGVIDLGGGTITVAASHAPLTDAAGSSLDGYGTIAGAFANAGAVEASGGTLEFTGAVTGTGTDTISGAATLEFGANASIGEAVSFTGSGGALELLNPKAFTGQISDFDLGGATGDSLILGKSWTFVSFAENSALTQGAMKLADGATTTTLTLLGDYTASFAHKTNASGQTVVTYT